MTARRRPVPATVDEYLRHVPPKSRAALQRLRDLIKAAAPKATESILYGMPTLRQGRMRLNLAAFDGHCSLYGWARVREKFSEELQPFETGRGTLRFTPEHPLPARLVRRMVKALVALDGAPADAPASSHIPARGRPKVRRRSPRAATP